MKLLLFLLTFSASANASTLGISGKVTTSPGCGHKVMVWLSLDAPSRAGRQLLLHTEVPVGGSYKFYTKAGEYQVRASDEAGCEFFSRLKVGEQQVRQPVKLVKK